MRRHSHTRVCSTPNEKAALRTQAAKKDMESILKHAVCQNELSRALACIAFGQIQKLLRPPFRACGSCVRVQDNRTMPGSPTLLDASSSRSASPPLTHSNRSLTGRSARAPGTARSTALRQSMRELLEQSGLSQAMRCSCHC